MRRMQLIALAALLALAGVAVGAAERPPNIVLLIGDDHDYPYFGFMGDRNVVTPSMDALAAGGYTFGTAHVTAPYCRPSLRSMITGLHPVQYVLRENEIVERRRQEDTRYAQPTTFRCAPRWSSTGRIACAGASTQTAWCLP